MIIGFVGARNSGKGTATEVAKVYGFVEFAYSDSVKDCCATLFCWPRYLLTGDTVESRIFRETVDKWWAEKLGIPDFCPRKAMTMFATDTMRNHFDDAIFTLNTEKRLEEHFAVCKYNKDVKVAFSDMRHPSEFELLEKNKGKSILIERGPKPEWYDVAYKANKGDNRSRALMGDVYKVHDSEYAWIGQNFDYTITNNGTIEEFRQHVDELLEFLTKGI